MQGIQAKDPLPIFLESHNPQTHDMGLSFGLQIRLYVIWPIICFIYIVHKRNFIDILKFGLGSGSNQIDEGGPSRIKCFYLSHNENQIQISTPHNEEFLPFSSLLDRTVKFMY